MFTALDEAPLLSRIELNIADAARLCGITARQLNYWTSKGYVKTLSDQPRRYGIESLTVAHRIKQYLAEGYSLDRAVRVLRDAIERSIDEPAVDRAAVRRQATLLYDELTALRERVEVELLRRRLAKCLHHLEQPNVVQQLSRSSAAAARSAIESAIDAIGAAIRESETATEHA